MNVAATFDRCRLCRRSIPPTEESFKIVLSACGHWKSGAMVEEYVSQDNVSFTDGTGLGR